VLHEALPGEGEKLYASTMSIPGGLEMTTSKDVLEAMAQGGGPRQVFVTLGYASWGGGQLESEIGENSWLTVEADHRLIFETPVAERYDRAMALLGLQSWMLSPRRGARLSMADHHVTTTASAEPVSGQPFSPSITGSSITDCP